MSLRTPNAPITESVLLSALVPILPVGTQLAAGSTSGNGQELLYVEQKYALAQGPFPAVLLSSGTQEYARNSRSTYGGTIEVYADYYDRWDEQTTATIDTIRTDITLELERMTSNIASFLTTNEGLTIGGATYPLSLVEQSIGGYTKANDPTFPGLSPGTKRLVLTFTILPYGV